MPTTRTYLDDLADLAITQTYRCLGCGEAMPNERWEPHGTCLPRYGTAVRVDYEQWDKLVRRFSDFEGFDRWADGRPAWGVQSYFTTAELVEIIQSFCNRRDM